MGPVRYRGDFRPSHSRAAEDRVDSSRDFGGRCVLEIGRTHQRTSDLEPKTQIERSGQSPSTTQQRLPIIGRFIPNALLVGTTRAAIGTLRDARIVSLAANDIVGIALLKQLQARLTARRGLCVSGWSRQH